MTEFDSAIFAADTTVDGTSLEIGTVRARSKLLIFLVDWAPIFEVIFFCSRCTEVASSNINNMIWNAELLPDFFLDSEDFLMDFFGLFWETEMCPCCGFIPRSLRRY